MPITALPTPPNRSMQPAVFVAAADAFLAALPTFVTETNTLGAQVSTDAAQVAADKLVVATDKATVASDKAIVAADKDTVATDKTAAQTAAAAAIAAAAVAVEGAAFTDTNPIVKGSVDATKKLRIEVDGLTTGTTRVLTVQDRNGVIADDTDLALKLNNAGGSLTGSVNELKGPDISSAATTMDIWTAAQGNVMTVTGTTATSGLPAAPQAGASRKLIAAGAWPLVHGANFLLPGSANRTCDAGDEVKVTALTTTQFRLTIIKADGTPVVPGASATPTVHTFSGAPTGTFSRGASAAVTYSQATTVVTVTHNAHGRATGDYVYADFTSGTAVDGWYPITVTNANTYTITQASRTTSGNVTVYPPVIITVTSQDAHGLSAGNTAFIDFSGTFTDGTFTVRQTSTASFQLEGSTGLPTAAAFTTLGAGTAGTVTLSSISKTDTWAKPAGLVAVKVTVVGGGSQPYASPTAGASAGGGTSVKLIPASSLGATEVVTIGNGGTLNQTLNGAPSGSGQSGGTSSFGAHCSATGATGGAPSGPGVPGVGSGGDVNTVGGVGVLSSNVAIGSTGGPSSLGGGAVPRLTDGNGNDAVTPGSGGSNLLDQATLGAYRAGYGAGGVVIVEEVY